MNFKPKIEPDSPSNDNIILDRDDADDDEVGADPVVVVEEETTLLDDLQGMTIHDLVQRVLLAACRAETYERVEVVLVTRDLELRDQIQHLQQQLQHEKLSRLHAEEEFNKRDQICEKWNKLQETHEALLKDSKKAQRTHENPLKEANGNIDLLKKKNVKLMCEVNKLTREKVEADKEFQVLSKMNEDLEGEINKLKGKMVEDGNVVQELEKLKEKRVEDGNALDVERRKNAELKHEVLELKGKRVDDENAIDMLKTKSGELECEVEKLKEKMVVDGNAFDVLKGKKCELESKVLELEKLKEKMVEDRNALDVVRRKNVELEHEVLELKGKRVNDENALDVIKSELKNKVLEFEKLKEKWLEDRNAVDELQRKVGEMEFNECAYAGLKMKYSKLKETVTDKSATVSKLKVKNRKLEDAKRKVESLLEFLNMKFRKLHERVARLEDSAKVLTSVGVSGGGNNEGEPPTADLMVADSLEKGQQDVGDNELRNEIVEETAPLQINEDGHHSHAGGSLNMQKDVEIINLDDEEDDQYMSQGEKNAISGICVKDEHPPPSSSIALQQDTKFANVVDTIKRKHSLPDSETSISCSSVDSSYLDTIMSVVSQPKKTKM